MINILLLHNNLSCYYTTGITRDDHISNIAIELMKMKATIVTDSKDSKPEKEEPKPLSATSITIPSSSSSSSDAIDNKISRVTTADKENDIPSLNNNQQVVSGLSDSNQLKTQADASGTPTAETPSAMKKRPSIMKSMFNRNKNKTPSSNNDDNDNNNDTSSTANTPSSLHPPSSTPPSSSSTGDNNKVITTDRVSDATGRQEEGEFRPLRGAFIDGPLSSPLSNESSSNKQAISTTDSPISTNAGGIASTSISKGKDTATVTSKGSFLSSMGGLLKRTKDSTKSTTSSPPLQTQTGEVSNTHDTVDKDTSKANSSIIKGSDKDSCSASEGPSIVDGGKEDDPDPPIQDGPKLSNASLVHSDSYNNNNNKEGTKTTKGVDPSEYSTMNTGSSSPAAAAMGTESSSSTATALRPTTILPKKKEDLLSMGTAKKASIDPLVVDDSSMTAVNRNSATATATASPHIGPKSSTSPTTIPSKKKKKDEVAAAVDGLISAASQASIGTSHSASVGIVDHNTTTGMQRVAGDILSEDTYNTTTTSTTTTTTGDHIHVGVGKGNDRSDTVLHAASEYSRVESQSPKESSHALTSATSTAATTIDAVDSRVTVTATTVNSTAITEKDDERKVMRMQMEQLLRDGDVSSKKGQHVESCLAFEGCLQLFKKLDDEKEEKKGDRMLLARIHNGLAMAYYNLGKGVDDK